MTPLQQAKKLFPRYKGRTVREDEQTSLVLYGRYWDEGNFRQYVLVDKAGNKQTFPDINPFRGPHDEVYVLQEGDTMYCHVYSGMRQYIQVYRPVQKPSEITS